jgi:hypothetical protein
LISLTFSVFGGKGLTKTVRGLTNPVLLSFTAFFLLHTLGGAVDHGLRLDVAGVVLGSATSITGCALFAALRAIRDVSDSKQLLKGLV